MKVIVTGGAGYIGSHTVKHLALQGHEIQVLDNLTTGSLEAITRVALLTKCHIKFTKIDIRSQQKLRNVFRQFKPDAVIHFAGVKSVSESMQNPQKYFDINVNGTQTLLNLAEDFDCNTFIFSSSATVYGEPKKLPCDEDQELKPVNPYGESKVKAEQLLNTWACTRTARRGVALRYFNPVGADESGLIGEDPSNNPTNLFPIISQVATGRRQSLDIYGNDYPTADGTGIRDYIHVSDLARAHVLALQNASSLQNFEPINIGTGKGLSVKQIVEEFSIQSGISIPTQIKDRRQGDVASLWADPSRAKQLLDFTAHLAQKQMCVDTWRWLKTNPNGYASGYRPSKTAKND